MKISIEDRVTPYHNIAYDEQIALKKKWLTKQLSGFCDTYQKLINQNREYPTIWFRERLEKKDEKEQMTCCDLSHVIQGDADRLHAYRNKVEFTIGRQYEGMDKKGKLTVGFSQGNLAKGIMFTGPADNISVISEESLYVAKKVEEVVQDIYDAHGIEPYDKMKNDGFWRLVLFRESKQTKQVLISLIVSEPKADTPMEEIKTKFLAKFEDKAIPGKSQLSIVSISIIYSDEMSGGYKEGDRSELLFGESMAYEEQINGFRFTVSPFAFF